ncbi:hypothetical protein V7182_24085 [Neobacillus drentensis]|uniref:hypothetical protein n=1 Tax=Neobacillus drentensis TaxID=220684 RepID=UPI00300029C9
MEEKLDKILSELENNSNSGQEEQRDVISELIKGQVEIKELINLMTKIMNENTTAIREELKTYKSKRGLF